MSIVRRTVPSERPTVSFTTTRFGSHVPDHDQDPGKIHRNSSAMASTSARVLPSASWSKMSRTSRLLSVALIPSSGFLESTVERRYDRVTDASNETLACNL